MSVHVSSAGGGDGRSPRSRRRRDRLLREDRWPRCTSRGHQVPEARWVLDQRARKRCAVASPPPRRSRPAGLRLWPRRRDGRGTAVTSPGRVERPARRSATPRWSSRIPTRHPFTMRPRFDAGKTIGGARAVLGLAVTPMPVPSCDSERRRLRTPTRPGTGALKHTRPCAGQAAVPRTTSRIACVDHPGRVVSRKAPGGPPVPPDRGRLPGPAPDRSGAGGLLERE
jgi:hypothetical protein